MRLQKRLLQSAIAFDSTSIVFEPNSSAFAAAAVLVKKRPNGGHSATLLGDLGRCEQSRAGKRDNRELLSVLFSSRPHYFFHPRFLQIYRRSLLPK